MKHVLVSCALAVVGCKQQAQPPPAPTGSGSSSGSGTTGSATAGSASGSAARCVITVAINVGTITYDGGGLAGNVDRKPGEAPNLDVLKQFAGKCSAFVTADPSLLYQDVILVMDTLVKDGIVDVSLGKPGDKPPATDDTKKHPDLPADVIKGEWKTGPDGRLMLEGTIKPQPAVAERLKNTPVLIVSKTQVMFQGKEIGKPDDSALAEEITVALPASPKDPTLILQADAQTPAAAITKIIDAARERGYTDLLFAVKTK
jgi:biopolymer transport protein ExbD